MSANVIALLYHASGVLFIMALRGLSSPETDRKSTLLNSCDSQQSRMPYAA